MTDGMKSFVREGNRKRHRDPSLRMTFKLLSPCKGTAKS